MLSRFLVAVAAMVAVVVASNYLVQFPVAAQLGPINLADILTWGAFTYPVAFLVTDLTNRHFGPVIARRVVYVGFAIAIVWSIALASPRIAIASGAAFLLAQTLDVVIFDRLRARYGSERTLAAPRTTLRAQSWSSPQGIADDLLEMLLLAQTRRMFLSYLSTFGEAAWWLGGARAAVTVF